MKILRTFVGSTLVLGVLLLAGTAWGQEASNASPKPTDKDTMTVVVAGQQVAIDRQTGKLRQPSPEESRALAEALKESFSRSVAGLDVFHYPDGSVSILVDGRFESASLAKVNSDGSVSTACVDNVTAAETFLESDDSKAGSSEKKTEKAPALEEE